MRIVVLITLLMTAACAAPTDRPAAVATPSTTQGSVPAAQAALNAIRAEAGRAPVVHSDRLSRAAGDHARDMAANNFFSHTGSNGSDVGARARRAGYDWCRLAENIAKVRGGLDGALDIWLRSPAHRANMLSPRFSEYGLAQAEGGVWVMMLGQRDC